MVELNVPAWAFILIWSFTNIGMLAAGWFLHGWYVKNSVTPPEDDYGDHKGKW